MDPRPTDPQIMTLTIHFTDGSRQAYENVYPQFFLSAEDDERGIDVVDHHGVVESFSMNDIVRVEWTKGE